MQTTDNFSVTNPSIAVPDNNINTSRNNFFEQENNPVNNPIPITGQYSESVGPTMFGQMQKQYHE